LIDKASADFMKGEIAMIKVSVMYLNTPGARFDFDYYCDKHLPLVKARLGAACKGCAVDKGLAGGEPGTPAIYVAIGHVFGESLEALQAAHEPHATEIMGDVPNFTDLTPIFQVNEMLTV
jgi:uncharacterized protein (TIGR02118 family)